MSTVILGAPETQRLLDFSRPMGLLCVAVLHFVPDADDPFAAMARLRDALAPGSFLAISHGTPGRPETDGVRSLYTQASNISFRQPEEIRRFFGDFELVEPGLVVPPQWRPEDTVDIDPAQVPGVGGVARKL
jgi:hypothetical protein